MAVPYQSVTKIFQLQVFDLLALFHFTKQEPAVNKDFRISRYDIKSLTAERIFDLINSLFDSMDFMKFNTNIISDCLLKFRTKITSKYALIHPRLSDCIFTVKMANLLMAEPLVKIKNSIVQASVEMILPWCQSEEDKDCVMHDDEILKMFISTLIRVMNYNYKTVNNL